MNIKTNTFQKTLTRICFITAFSVLTYVLPLHAQNCEEKLELYSQPNTKTRGKLFFTIEPGKITGLKSSISKADERTCYFKVTNNTAFDVNVFVDSVYIGYVLPGKHGYYKPAAQHKVVHCWSSAGDIRWMSAAGCSGCSKNFVLLYKKQ
jgi:hypothetical protein